MVHLLDRYHDGVPGMIYAPFLHGRFWFWIDENGKWSRPFFTKEEATKDCNNYWLINFGSAA